MVDDAMLELSMVDGVVEEADGEEPHTMLLARKGAPWSVVHRRRHHRRRQRRVEDEVEDDVVEPPKLRCVLSLLDPATCRG